MFRREFLKLIAAASPPTFAASLYAAPGGSTDAQFGDLQIQLIRTDHFEVRLTRARPEPLRLLQLADTHFHPGDGSDAATASLIRKLVDHHKPDFVVHTGDFVNNDSDKPVDWTGMDVLNDLQLPWTLCFGNHDYPVRQAPGSLSLSDIRGKMERGFQGYIDDGTGRHYCYRYDVFRRERSIPDTCLFFFQVGYAQGDRQISDAQLSWFERQMQSDRDRGVDAPVTVFVHIPLFEYHALFESGRAHGVRGEKVCFDSDSGQSFLQFSKSNRVVGVFCGHDHVNNYHGPWKGVDLVYGRVTGVGAYGPKEWARGGRLITLDLHSERVLPIHYEVF